MRLCQTIKPDDPKLREKFAKSFAPKKLVAKVPRPTKSEAAKRKTKSYIKKFEKKLADNPPDRVTKNMPTGTLNSKQRSFVKAYVHEGQTKTRSAIMAGYSPKSASSSADDLMRLPKIQAAVAKERESYAIASGVTRKQVVDGLIEAVEMAKIKADPLAMIAGWREVGKMLGYYEPTKVDLNVSVTGKALIERMNSMSDAELLAQLEGPDSNVIEGEFTSSEADSE